MKHLLRRAAALALAAAMTLTLTGCIFRSSVEDLFTLPRVAAEYAGLSQELDDLQKQGYELIAPAPGRISSPFRWWTSITTASPRLWCSCGSRATKSP